MQANSYRWGPGEKEEEDLSVWRRRVVSGIPGGAGKSGVWLVAATIAKAWRRKWKKKAGGWKKKKWEKS